MTLEEYLRLRRGPVVTWSKWCSTDGKLDWKKVEARMQQKEKAEGAKA